MASDLAVLPDAELLARYRTGRGADAFAEIVNRHGGMVYRTSLRLVGNPQDAEDATQAVFLVLARRCQAVRDSLGGWLHKVAHDTASKLLRGRTRQERRDKAAAMMRAHLSPSPNADIREEVDAALTRLPAHLREAVVLRYLEGWDQEEAALMAGCPRGTLSWRATEGLNRLRTILAGRGTLVAPTALAGFLTQEASAAVPATLPAAVQQAVLHGNASAQVVQLAQGVSNTMALAKAKPWLAALAGLAAVAVPLTMYLAQPAAPQLRTTLLGHTDTPLTAAFSPDGTKLATAGRDRTVRIWDVATRQEIFQQQIGNWVHDVQFSPDGKHLAACNGFQSLHVWEGGAHRAIDVRRDTLRETAHCYCLAFAPDGKTLSGAVFYTDYRLHRHLEVQTWETATLKQLQRRSWERARFPRQLQYAADGKSLMLIGGQERTPQEPFEVLRERWEVSGGRTLPMPALPPTPANDAVNPQAMSSDGTLLVTQSLDRRLRLWKGQGSAPVLLPESAVGVHPAFSPDSRWLVMATTSGVKVFDVDTDSARLTLPRQAGASVALLRFAPDGRLLAVGCHDGSVELWDLPTQR